MYITDFFDDFDDSVNFLLIGISRQCGYDGYFANDMDDSAATGAGTGFNYDGEYLEVPQIRVTTDDGNGVVEIVDATKIQCVLAMMESDDDGMITVRAAVSDGEELCVTDATMIQRYMALMDDPYELDTPTKTRLREL